MAIDKYYVNLTRIKIQDALSELIQAQHYMSKSGIDCMDIKNKLNGNISSLQIRLRELEEHL